MVMRLWEWFVHRWRNCGFRYHLVPETIAILMIPVVWMVLDRRPPITRLHGDILNARTMAVEPVMRGEDVRVRYVTTKRRGADCPGTIQQEIVDNNNTIFSKLARSVGPAKWEAHPTDPDKEIFTGHPVNIPAETAPGPAIFRTVTFRYCNWFQQNWPGNAWPIVQIGPDIHFTIKCQDGYEEVWEGRRSSCVSAEKRGT